MPKKSDSQRIKDLEDLVEKLTERITALEHKPKPFDIEDMQDELRRAAQRLNQRPINYEPGIPLRKLDKVERSDGTDGSWAGD